MSSLAPVTPTEFNTFEFDEDNWYDWNGHAHYYKGTVFVPVKVDYFSAQSGSGEKLPPAYS